MGASTFRRAIPMATFAGLLLVLAPASAASASAAHARDHRVKRGTSTNWSGYALTGPGPYESVSASWTQPPVNCAVTRSGNSAFWVGLDGDTTETVEQTGTEANCVAGKASYGAWYEMYPRGSVGLSEPVSSGDSFTASVKYLGKAFFGLTSKFQLTLSDVTQGWSRSETKYLNTAELGSAEVIAEAPSSVFGVLPLSDFGSVSFTGFTVDGSPVSASTPSLEPITMASEGKVKAEPSALSNGSFSDTWFSK
jgi:hypothetical protein